MRITERIDFNHVIDIKYRGQNLINTQVKSPDLADTFCITIKSPYNIDLNPHRVEIKSELVHLGFKPNPWVEIDLGIEIRVPNGYGILATAPKVAHKDYIMDRDQDYYSVFFKPRSNPVIFINKGEDLMKLFLLKQENLIFKYTADVTQ